MKPILFISLIIIWSGESLCLWKWIGDSVFGSTKGLDDRKQSAFLLELWTDQDELNDYYMFRKAMLSATSQSSEKPLWSHLARLFSQDLKQHSIGCFQVQNRESLHYQHRLVHITRGFGAMDNILSELEGVDIWHHSDSNVIACLSPSAYEELSNHPFYEDRINVIDNNVQSRLDDETNRLKNNQERDWSNILVQNGSMSWFNEYHTYEETKAWYQDLADEYSNLMTFSDSIGSTYENRSIFTVTITDKSIIFPKKAIFLHGLQHAREWISGSTVNYIAYSLLSKFGGSDAESYLITSLLRKLEFIIVPIMNPDGYEYSWTTNRLWRKNRSPSTILPFVTGVDLNRNWDDHWGTAGSSSNPYSDIYMGPHAASEAEVRAMSQFFYNHSNIILAIDFHAYSQLVLWPYGYTERYYKFHKEHSIAADIISNSINNVSRKDYRPERICDLYIASGNSVDFYSSENTLKHLPSRPYAFTIELRPALMDPRGFVLDPEEIIPTGHEILSSLLSCITHIQRNPIKEDV